MKKFALLALALCLSGFSLGCTPEAPKKTTPAPETKMEGEKAPEATPPAKEEEPKK
jgi:hypothetical protein